MIRRAWDVLRQTRLSLFQFLWALMCAIVIMSIAVKTQAQVTATAETSGKGKTSAMFAVAKNSYAGTDGTGGYIWLGYGLNDRIDVFTIDGWSSVPNETQAWLGVGTNIRTGKYAGFDTSSYSYLTFPVTKRSEASTALLNTALIASRHFGLVVPYFGVNAVVPLGKTYQSTFTPPSTEWQIPVGINIPVGKFGLLGEVDLGKLRVFGVALSYTP